MGLSDNLNSILEVKKGLKNALIGKGVSMDTCSFPQYPSIIASLGTSNATCDTTGAVVDFTFSNNVKSVSYFKGWEDLNVLRFPANVSKITDSKLGLNCVNLTDIYIYNTKDILTFNKGMFPNVELQQVALHVPESFVEIYGGGWLGEQVNTIIPIE